MGLAQPIGRTSRHNERKMARYNGGAYVSLADSPSNSGASPPRATTASAAAVSATSTTSASASGHEYNELPVAQAQGEEDLAEQTTAASAAEASAELAEGVAPEQEGHAAGGGGSTKNKANSEAKRKKRGAEREKEGTDLTGGLPTTEGVFVGSPVTRQSEYSMPRMPRTVAPHTGPTVLAPSGDSRVDLGSSPPPYNPGGGLFVCSRLHYFASWTCTATAKRASFIIGEHRRI